MAERITERESEGTNLKALDAYGPDERWVMAAFCIRSTLACEEVVQTKKLAWLLSM